MSKRSQHPDPADPMQWIGQPYIPQRRSFFLDPGQFRSPLKTYGFYGCLLLGAFALTWAALIAVGLIQTNGLGFWALLVLIGAAIIGTLAGVASARRRHQARKAPRHHKHHKTG
jgi:hypothetical protein